MVFPPILQSRAVIVHANTSLHVHYDSNDWAAEPVAMPSVHIYPLGEDQVVRFERPTADTDHVIVDNEEITIIVTGYHDDPIWGYTAELFLVNNTDKELTFRTSEVSVNGFMCDAWYAESVHGGVCVFSSMSWSDADLEENGITELESIEFQMKVYDAEDWLADALFLETITLNP